MPMVSLKLKPSVDVELTPTLNEAGISDCNLIRFKSKLPQKLGGWERFYPGQVNGTPRALWAWADLEEVNHLGVGATAQLAMITDGVLKDITPQQKTTNPTPDFSITSGTTTVTVVDPNVANVTTLDTVFFNTPVSVGGIILSGMYQITAIISTHSYQIEAATAATGTGTNAGTVPVFDTAEGDATIEVTLDDHGQVVDNIVVFQIPTSVGGLTVNGSYKVSAINSGDVFSITGPTHATSTATVAMNTALAQLVYYINLGPPAVGTGYGTGIYGGVVTTGAVAFTYHDLNPDTITRGAGSFLVDGFAAGMSITISGTVSNNITATIDTVVALTITLIASDSLVNEGPVSSTIVGMAIGWGGVGFTASEQTGTPITTDNWSEDNWGEILLACPFGGTLYYYPPTGSISAEGHVPGGLDIAGNIATAPVFNGGMFVAMPAQILVAWGSSTVENIGVLQDPLLVRWSDQLNFTQWTDNSTTQAGAYHVPSGSKIMGAIQAQQQALIFTDIDLYSMVYQGPPLVFGFNKIGTGCGLIGQHAVTSLRGITFWMSNGDFFVLTGNGVQPLPCSVWDFVFQDLDQDNAWKCVAGANSLYNEIRFDFPSLSGGTGENDKYVKFNIEEQSWDKGYDTNGIPIARSAWIDQSVLGQPIGASPSSRLIYEHETSLNADGVGMPTFFKTGNFVLNEGNSLANVLFIMPDFKWGQVGGSQNAIMNVTIGALDYPNQTEHTYGPMTFTSTTQYDVPRIRGREINVLVQNSNLDSFWRLGNTRARVTVDGAR